MIIKKIKPLFTAVVTTMDRYTVDDFDGKLVTNIHQDVGSVKEHQKVLAVGDLVRNIAVGDIVKINPKRYEKHKYKEDSAKVDLLGQQTVGYDIPIVEIDGKDRMFLQQQDIEYVVEEWEEEEKTADSPIIHPNNSIIIP